MFGKDNRFDYFKAFSRLAEFACSEADLVVRLFSDYDPKDLSEHLAQAHVIEHNADLVNHEIYTNLASEFVAPLEREDISSLASDLDSVIDNIEDVVQRLYMFNIKAIPPEACEMAGIIDKACYALRDSLVDFPTFKHSTATLGHIIDVNTLEEEGDQVYMRAIHELFVGKTDPIATIAWENMFAKLERCCDACEHVADVIQTVIMKNS